MKHFLHVTVQCCTPVQHNTNSIQYNTISHSTILRSPGEDVVGIFHAHEIAFLFLPLPIRSRALSKSCVRNKYILPWFCSNCAHELNVLLLFPSCDMYNCKSLGMVAVVTAYSAERVHHHLSLFSCVFEQ